jgi:hypothetical protein
MDIFLSPSACRDGSVAVFNQSGKMLHYNKALCFSIRVYFMNFICSLTNELGTFVNMN